MNRNAITEKSFLASRQKLISILIGISRIITDDKFFIRIIRRNITSTFKNGFILFHAV